MSVTAVPIRPLKKGSVVRLWIGLALLVAGAVALAWYGTRSLQYEVTGSGLRYRVVEEGKGAHPTLNDVAFIDYTGKLADGTVFDSTKGRQPVPMPVGKTIPGFSEALQLMRKGGRYELHIPPQLAYGKEGAGGVIPPDATLTFDVTMHDYMPWEVFQQQMMGAMGGMGGAGGAPQP